MDSPLKKSLIEKYPDLWPKTMDGAPIITRYSPSCDDGWFNIIDNVLGEIDKFCKLYGGIAKVVQIKEKFGGLRVYVDFDGEDAVIQKKIYEACKKPIAKAEHDSHFTCEVCGGAAELMCKQDRSWLKTICQKCIDFAASPYHTGYVKYAQPKPLGE